MYSAVNCSRRAAEQSAWFRENASTCTIVRGAQLDPVAPLSAHAMTRASLDERKEYIESALRANDCLMV